MKNKILLILSIIVIVTLIIVGGIFISNNNNQKADDNNKNQSETQIENKKPTTNNTDKPIINNVSNELSEQEKAIFNSKFDMYIGKNVKGNRVKVLIASISSSNENNNTRKVELIINGESATDSNKIVSSKTYTVEFEYDGNGLINKAIIKEN